MHKYQLTALAIYLGFFSLPVAADYSVDIVHYSCNQEEKKVTVWYEQLTNTEGTFYDKPFEGAYNPSDLVEWNQEFYRMSRASKKSPIKKTCQIGEHKILVEIHFAGVCQDGALASITIYSENKKLYETKGFGTSCSSGETVGPELVDRITVTPGHVDVQSGFWFW